MTYYQFVQTVEKIVREKIDSQVTVSVYHAMKNNGINRSGLLLADGTVNVSPTIYLEEYYSRFLQGETLEGLSEEILRLYEKIRFRRSWNEDILKNYSGISDKIVYRFIGAKMNQDLLRGIPYVPFLDLAIVFYVLLETTPYGAASMLIQNYHLDIWGVSYDQVYQQARENTYHLLPYEFKPMGLMLEELTGVKDVFDTAQDSLFVLTNQNRSFGAAAILYPGRMQEIGHMLRDDYYVLPSSIHETLILPRNASPHLEREYLKEIVTEINQTQVPKEDVLSDEVYLYNRREDRLIL